MTRPTGPSLLKDIDTAPAYSPAATSQLPYMDPSTGYAYPGTAKTVINACMGITQGAGKLAYSDGTAIALSSAGTLGQVWTVGASGVPTPVDPSTKVANLAGGLIGQIPYQTALDTTAFLAAGTAGQIFQSGGAGAPSWVNASTLTVGTATNATNATNGAVTVDATNATRYLCFVSATTGNLPELVSSTLTFNPSTSALGGIKSITPPSSGSGVGNDLFIKADDGHGTGAGGNTVFQAAAQATSGGNGVWIFKNAAGVEKARILETGQFISSTAGVGFGWAAAGATTITHGLRNSTIGQGFITIVGQGNNLLSVDSNNGIIQFAAVEQSANYRVMFINNANSEATASGTFAFSCSKSYGVLYCRDGQSTLAGGSFAYPKGLLNLTVTGTVNDLQLDGSAFQKITGASTPILTSILYPSGGTGHADGRRIYLVGGSATATVLKHNAGTGTAANRLYSSTGADLSLAQNKIAMLIYDSTDNGSGGPGWRMTLLP